MIDFHAHILPEMDDGSRSPEESAAMLTAMSEQGVTAVVATPHFYPDSEDPTSFLARRKAAVEKLRSVWNPGMPKVYLGAEVAFFNGISRSAALPQLCTIGTDMLLVEMPFLRWPSTVIGELDALRTERGFVVIVAHIERYAEMQPRGIEQDLAGRGILLQANAEYYLSRHTARQALRQYGAGVIPLLGSDAHNMTFRPPKLGEAAALLRGNAPQQFARFALFSDVLLKQAEPVAG